MEAPNGKEYEGPSGIGRDSIWLTHEDLFDGKDTHVTIDAVMLYAEVTYQGGRKKNNVLALKFANASRVLAINATNRKALNTMFGNLTKAWVGQKITLYVTTTQMAGETVPCVRIRNTGSRVASAADSFLKGKADGQGGLPLGKAN